VLRAGVAGRAFHGVCRAARRLTETPFVTMEWIMFKRLLAFSLLTFAALTATTRGQAPAPIGGGRDADRAAIRAHIESIFEAFVSKDIPKLRATHSDDWRGFLEGSPVAIKGIEEYMTAIGAGPNSTGGVRNPATGMKSYTITSYDTLFHGPDTAIVSFVADIETRAGGSSTLRIMDVYSRRSRQWIQTASHTVVHPRAIEKQMSAPSTVSPQLRQQILDAREKVWRAWFTNDQAHLAEAIPEDAVAINADSDDWADRAAILAGAKQFAASGGKLVRLEFPRTEIQMYGRTVVIYTSYVFEIEVSGQKSTQSGRGTETFVIRGGQLVNTGWHLDAGVRTAGATKAVEGLARQRPAPRRSARLRPPADLRRECAG
jgi:ketosteroid isomerase-like protein